MMAGGMWFTWLLPLLLITILLILGGIWLVNNGGFNGQGRTHSGMSSETDTPEEILKKRYARGEISREEYEEMRQALD